jgi:hypothetical protein
MGNFLKTIFIIIISGYVLVSIKLYEFIGIVIILTIICIINYISINSSAEIKRRYVNINAYIYDLVDKKIDIKEGMIDKFYKKKTEFSKLLQEIGNKKTGIFSFIIIGFIFIFSAYLRFYDAFKNPAPAMSDGAVTLSWIKNINERKLFIDGIYPQGFSIYMATLLKFSYINPLYILKYSGPFNEFLILFGIYFFSLKITGKRLPAIISIAIYGLMYKYLPGEYERQAATNSQEFGFVFIFPTLYFYYKYLEFGEKGDCLTALAGLTASGLVHLIAFAFTGLGLFIVLLVYILFQFKTTKKRILYSIVTGILSILISAMPAIIGHYLLRIKYYGSSESYAKSILENISLRNMGNREYLVLIILLVLLVYSFLIIMRKTKQGMGIVFITFYSVVAFFLYYAGGTLTKLEVVENRSAELISLLIPVILGIWIWIIAKLLNKFKYKELIEQSLCVGIIVFVLIYIKPNPIIPYKMLRGIAVEKYLEISKKLLPTEWMVVSYDDLTVLARGSGYHLMIDDFVSRYSPENEQLLDNETGEFNKIRDVFIFYEKEIFLDKVESITYSIEKRQRYANEIKSWIDKYKEKSTHISLYYEDDKLSIYRINQNTYNNRRTMMWEGSNLRDE